MSHGHRHAVSVLPLLAAVCSAPGLAAGQTVTVDVGSVIRESPAVGINVDYLMDDDSRRPGAPSLGDTLQQMGVAFVRYPGGEKSDAYLFSVPPFTESIPTLARTGSGEWPAGDRNFTENDNATFSVDVLDFDEFVAACRVAGAEPTIVVAFDSMYKAASPDGTAPTREQLLEHAVAWVRYANVIQGYSVKYWELGNESYHHGSYNGTAPSAEVYAADVRAFADAMKAVDPSILIGANGGDDAWWRAVVERAGDTIDFLVPHNYPTWQYTAGYESYRTSTSSFDGETRRALAAIDAYASEGDRQRLFVAITETGAVDWSDGGWSDANDLGHALATFEILGNSLLLPRVRFVQFWNTRWVDNETRQTPYCLDALAPNSSLYPTGHAVAIWGRFLRASLVSASGTPAVRAFASYDDADESLSVFLLHKDLSRARIEVALPGFDGPLVFQRWMLSGDGPEDTTPVWSRQSDVVRHGDRLEVTLDPVSITVLSTEPPQMDLGGADAGDAASGSASSEDAGTSSPGGFPVVDASVDGTPATGDSSARGCGCQNAGTLGSPTGVVILLYLLLYLLKKAR